MRSQTEAFRDEAPKRAIRAKRLLFPALLLTLIFVNNALFHRIIALLSLRVFKLVILQALPPWDHGEGRPVTPSEDEMAGPKQRHWLRTWI